MSNRTDLDYLKDILEAATRAVDYCSELQYDAFLKDTKTQDAVVRNLEIVGEAVKNLSQETRNREPSIPWKNISGMRDRLIHDYFGVNWDVVWSVVKEDLRDIMRRIENMLSET